MWTAKELTMRRVGKGVTWMGYYNKSWDDLRRRLVSTKSSGRIGAPLTELAHHSIRHVLGPGDFAIDATAGNGHDTVFLANRVGPTGQVLALDIQPQAIQATRERLRASECEKQVKLIHCCHSLLHEHYLPTDAPLQVAMFNLGFLPGSINKKIVTKPETTLAALSTCLDHLSQGGLISVMIYRCHNGGKAEVEAIADFLGGLPTERYQIKEHEASGSGPQLRLIKRL